MTRAEAEKKLNDLLEAASAMRYMRANGDEGEIETTRTRFFDAFQSTLAALTAAPEKPRVDVRKVWGEMRNMHPGRAKPSLEVLTSALRAAGVEVVE